MSSRPDATARIIGPPPHRPPSRGRDQPKRQEQARAHPTRRSRAAGECAGHTPPSVLDLEDLRRALVTSGVDRHDLEREREGVLAVGVPVDPYEAE
jgi:hypothetical protein